MTISDVEDEHSQSASPQESDRELDVETAGYIESTEGKVGASTNVKDPNRPRRKKARRACFACQRAHLTCGDERPCQRCVKRGLQDVCQDGVRKKAKYLHDAPNEALLPGAAGQYKHGEFKQDDMERRMDSTQQAASYHQPHNFNLYGSSAQMPPPILHDASMNSTNFGQSSPVSGVLNVPGPQPLRNSVVTQDSQVPANPEGAWSSTFFDSGDASMLNFDLASMNFGNHYGALEFGMLGHMATGAGETPESETGTQRGSISQYTMPLSNFGEASNAPFGYGNEVMLSTDWANNGSTIYNHMASKDAPHAFAIETSAPYLTSPEATNTPPDAMRHEDTQTSQIGVVTSGQEGGRNPFESRGHLDGRKTSEPRFDALTPKGKLPNSRPAKRPQDPTSIYTSVTSPYPYTAGFHQLIAYLQTRFSSAPSKTLAIAKSLASIRPSFIATNKTLKREDLIFMEKCFQRTLWEYENFIEGVGTPTIVARRTGEIAAVGKEFQILTGWTKNVLLGRTPNLNVNQGHSGKTPAESGANSVSRATGANTPLPRFSEDSTERQQQPVFLAELLDDDSVVQFYEDFARLAFGDSRGSVMGKGKLLKYRTKDDQIAANLREEAASRGEPDGAEDRPGLTLSDSFMQKRPQDARKGISGEQGMQRLGSSDGKVDCAYCWTVKRDVFDIPMLIVMNFLPCI